MAQKEVISGCKLLTSHMGGISLIFNCCRSDWTLDLTHPRVNAQDGWQYARILDDTEDKWSPDMPAPLERLLGGSGIMSGMASSSSGASSSVPSSPSASLLSPRGKGRAPSNTNLSFARRRRWVRVMRRRLDISPLPFLQPNGKFYSLTESGALIPYVPEDHRDNQSVLDSSDAGGVELSSTPSGLAGRDYVARARYLADGRNNRRASTSGSPDLESLDATQMKRIANKLERAIGELRIGLLSMSAADNLLAHALY